MTISLLQEQHWPDIIDIQKQAYSSFGTESLNVLKSKQRNSPEFCFVIEKNNIALAYLLCHYWPYQDMPKLFKSLPDLKPCKQVFIHDLAINLAHHKQGLGRHLVEHLLETLKQNKITKVTLVSVQESTIFWQKLGFEVSTYSPCLSYGKDTKVMYLTL